MILAYLEYAATYYRRPDGTSTNEIALVKLVSRPVRELYGNLPADEFGPLTLLATRERFISFGWSRRTVNQQVDRLRRIFRWGTERELVTGGVYQALAALSPLKAGRYSAPESVPVKPADPVIVAATLAFLNRHVRTMILLQQLTGMRPGEVCRMRLIEIDRTSEQGTYRPARHKSQHRGKCRTIMIGPRGRGVLEEFLAEGGVVDPSAPLFSPWRAREAMYALLRAKRKTKVQPSQVDRRTPNARKLAAQYSVNAYCPRDPASRGTSRDGTLAPESVATPLRFGSSPWSRTGSRTGATRACPCGRHPSVRRAE